MKTKSILLFLIGLMSFGVTSCSKNDNSTVADPSAISYYIINNQSSELLVFSNEEGTIEIPPLESKELAIGGGMGSTIPPQPSEYFDSLVLFRNDNGTMVIAVVVEPIIDEQWVEEQLSTNISNFVFAVTNDMIE